MAILYPIDRLHLHGTATCYFLSKLVYGIVCSQATVPLLKFVEQVLGLLEFDHQEERLLQYFGQIFPAVTALKIGNPDQVGYSYCIISLW